MEHQPPKHSCPVCAKGYPFKSELDRHITVYSTVLPFACEKCPKWFSQIKTKNRHVHVHDNKSFVCSQCDKVADTNEKLYSHFRGAHGKGNNAKCGKHFQWPATCARHQENCDTCKVIIEQEQKVKETKTKLNLASMSVKKPPKKKLKKEDSTETSTDSKQDNKQDALQETKRAIGHKLEKILELKKDL